MSRVTQHRTAKGLIATKQLIKGVCHKRETPVDSGKAKLKTFRNQVERVDKLFVNNNIMLSENIQEPVKQCFP